MKETNKREYIWMKYNIQLLKEGRTLDDSDDDLDDDSNDSDDEE